MYIWSVKIILVVGDSMMVFNEKIVGLNLVWSVLEVNLGIIFFVFFLKVLVGLNLDFYFGKVILMFVMYVGVVFFRICWFYKWFFFLKIFLSKLDWMFILNFIELWLLYLEWVNLIFEIIDISSVGKYFLVVFVRIFIIVFFFRIES